MKRESVELGTPTVLGYTTPPPSYETPISGTRIEGLPIATSVDDVCGVSEDVHTFASESFGAVASSYLSPFVNRSGVLDIDNDLRKEGDKFFIGNSDVTVDANSDVCIKNKHFIGTPGLWELLTRKCVNKKLVNKDDLKQYKRNLNLTSAHLKGYEPDAAIHVSLGIKFRTVIAKLFPKTKRRGIEASLRKEWGKC
jgi:hypothetical protein